MRSFRWLACGGFATLGGVAFIVAAFYAYGLFRELDARLYPWGQRRDSHQRPMLSGCIREARRLCAVPDGAPTPSPHAVIALPVAHTDLPDLATPPTLNPSNFTLSQFKFVWLPLEYLDVSEGLYQITIFARYSDSRRMPETLQIAFGTGETLRAELPPAERREPSNKLRFYSGCWQGGQFTPPLGWQGYTPEVAWNSFDWVVVYPTDRVKKSMRWLFPKNLKSVVYFNLRWDEAGGVAEAVIAYARTDGQPFKIGVVDDKGVRTVSLVPASTPTAGALVNGYRFCQVRGEAVVDRFPRARSTRRLPERE